LCTGQCPLLPSHNAQSGPPNRTGTAGCLYSNRQKSLCNKPHSGHHTATSVAIRSRPSQTKIRPSRRLRALAIARRQPRFPSHRPESFHGRLQTSDVPEVFVFAVLQNLNYLCILREVHEDHAGMVGQISTGCRPPQPACVRPGSSARCTANVVSALYRSVRHSAQFSIFSPLIRLNAWSLVTSTAPNAKA
jgi:hypothetical protein